MIMVGGAASSACSSGEPVDIGDDKVESLGASLRDYAGEWEGYAEVHAWDDGSDAIRLVLDEDGSGVLEVGHAAPLPPPARDQPYPPVQDRQNMDKWFDSYQFTLVSGFDYPVSGASVEGRRLRAVTATKELQREWCEMQTSHLVEGASPATYACQPWTGFAYADGHCYVGMDATPIDCGKLACTRPCQCDADACGIDVSPDVQLDAALQADGDELRGSLLVGSTLINIQLTRL
jgi:hypothetical protein